jgi:hypothetical protein
VCRLHSLLTLNRAVANIGRRRVSVVGWGGAGRTVRSPHSSVLADAAHNKKMFFFNFTFFSLILLLLVE